MRFSTVPIYNKNGSKPEGRRGGVCISLVIYSSTEEKNIPLFSHQFSVNLHMTQIKLKNQKVGTAQCYPTDVPCGTELMSSYFITYFLFQDFTLKNIFSKEKISLNIK